ncbi:hypothetical protein [Clostridium sp. DJ247]|uniref:hypothetical protein n=1 Tax=Clostridium sp. DJ247 TaxID=2726188 RepID=UPI001623EDFF|nr:hypothetical protein [Clostridium sp. DJ247]MBC2580543.1 hypothetical protein [Clostridium sp. DJ247]
MEHIDEKILDFINQAEKANEPKNICEGPVKVGDRYYEFEEREFFDEKLKLYIPKDFEEMAENLRELKYPSSNRPQIIKTDETGSINITLNKIDNDLQEEWVKELTDGMKSIIKKTNPANVFFSDGVERVADKNIGYFEFKSSAIDDFVYNIMFFFELEGKTVMGTFSCLYKDYENWREIAFQVIKTIKVVKEE